MPLVEKISEKKPGFIDVRGPRVSAGITAVLLLVIVFLGLIGPSTSAETSVAARLIDPAFILLLVAAILFAIGAFAGPGAHPFGIFYRTVIVPRIAPATLFEDPKPPRFAQLVGLFVSGVGVVLGIFLPWAVVVAAAFAFVAAFLNSVFGYCLGCELYLYGQRLRSAKSAA